MNLKLVDEAISTADAEQVLQELGKKQGQGLLSDNPGLARELGPAVPRQRHGGGKMSCSTNMVRSLNAWSRKGSVGKEIFPTSSRA